MKIIIGSGSQKYDGWTTLDKLPNVMPDICHDLTHYPWPFDSDSADEVICSHVLEHVVEQGKEEQFFAFFKELWRVCADKAIVLVVVPDAHGSSAFSDPGHKSFYSKNIFSFVSQKSAALNRESHTQMTEYGIDFDFDILQLNVINGDIHCRLQAVK